jgi:uncharacterized membrane protein (DUF2068 family)
VLPVAGIGSISDAMKLGSGHPEKDGGLRLIAAFKIAKGLLLLAAAAGAFSLLHRDLEDVALAFARALHADPEGRLARAALSRIGVIDARRLVEIGIGTLCYAALLLTEGIGLWLRKPWAEYLTVIATSLLIPLEAYELVRRDTATRIAVIVINVSVVWYLVRQLRRHPRG